jgi:hypothetical protein
MSRITACIEEVSDDEVGRRAVRLTGAAQYQSFDAFFPSPKLRYARPSRLSGVPQSAVPGVSLCRAQ